MKSTRGFRLFATIASAILLSGNLTQALPDDILDGSSPEFDALAQELELNLDGRCVGYGYAVFQNESFVRGGGGGVRRKAKVGRPSLPFTTYTRKGCHSMSKAITAAAMLRALQMRNISIDSPIYPHLPKKIQDFAADPDFQDITFRDLLAHRSGIPEGGWGWIDLLQGAATPNVVIGSYDYANWNYAVCRTLIPFVVLPAQLRDMETLAYVDLNAYCASVYTNFVQAEILKPAGIPNASWMSPADIDNSNFSYYYNWNDPSVEEVMPNRFLTIGSGGWAMSAHAYALFMARLQSGNFLSGNVLTNAGPRQILYLMRNSELGMFDSFGKRFYDHSGSNTYTKNGKEYGGRSQWVFDTHYNVTVCVQVNCKGAFASGELYTIITDAIKNHIRSNNDGGTGSPSEPSPEETEEHQARDVEEGLPTPNPDQNTAPLDFPTRLDCTHHSGVIALSFNTVEGAAHIIETLEDGLRVPVHVVLGDGSAHSYQPKTRSRASLFQLTSLPPVEAPTALDGQ